jgi:hypothetical protein
MEHSLLLNSLPLEINNIMYSYLGKSKTAVIIKEYFESMNVPNIVVCDKCLSEVEPNVYGGINGYECLCEYCYAKVLGLKVFYCDNCNDLAYDWLDYENTEHARYCKTCYDFRLGDENDDEDR